MAMKDRFDIVNAKQGTKSKSTGQKEVNINTEYINKKVNLVLYKNRNENSPKLNAMLPKGYKCLATKTFAPTPPTTYSWYYVTFKDEKTGKTYSGWVQNKNSTLQLANSRTYTSGTGSSTNNPNGGNTPGKSSNVTNSSNNSAVAKTVTEPKNPDDFDDLREEKFTDYTDFAKSNPAGDLVIQNARGIHGMPYQFLPSADRRLVDANGKEIEFGRKYAERIVTRMPLLLLTPGEPNYMTGFAKETKNNVLEQLINVGINQIDESLDNILNGKDNSSRYFTLDFAYKQYYQYVNSMLRMGALFLGLHGVTLPEKYSNGKATKQTQLGNFDWSYYTSSHLPGVLSSNEYVAFYVDSETQISESFSNSTTESILANKMKSGSEVANELKFIMGNYGIDDALIDNDTLMSMKDSFQKFIDSSPLTNNRLMSRLINDAKVVVTGGKMIFPEIWSDSSFSRSYDINIKLRTPDCDKLSWYMNIFVPLAHLICLTAPRQVAANGKTNPNAYTAPFLIRGFYKGILSVEMGIITSMSINKGGQSSWTVDGLPTQVDVNINLKDLYDGMAINQFIGRSSFALLKNTSMTDYIATSCGININKPDIRRIVDYWAMQKYNRITDIPRHAWLSVQQALASSVYTFLKDGKITF